VSPRRRWLAGAAFVVALFVAAPAAAFELEGHEIIEAVAYKRLMAMDAVPGTGPPAVSGRLLLARLIATGVLLAPPCFDRTLGDGDCDAEARLAQPLAFWPLLGSGTPDLVLDRQLGQRGQCQHFMAKTSDGLTPIDPRFGVPGDLATVAYARCARLAGVVFDGILRDPYRAGWRLAGTYAFMHAIQDSFSAAHANRDARFRIVHLLSWKLIDWPRYFAQGRGRFPAATHHGLTDDRDKDYLDWKGSTPDGQACKSFRHPYAVPEVCLTPRAKAAAAAVVAFLVLIYQTRTSADGQARPTSLFSSSDASAGWLAYLRAHLASDAAPAELPEGPQSPLPRSDVLVGVQGLVGDGAWGAGLWNAKLFFVRPVIPFALGLTGAVVYVRSDQGRYYAAAAGLNLLLPLVRRFTIGASPAGVRFACDTRFDGCAADLVATAGVLLIPVGDAVWFGLEGPQYSWTTRDWGRTWLGLSLGWAHERGPRPRPPGADAIASWDPPRPDQVHAYRAGLWTRALYFGATVASKQDNAFVGVGMDWRRDRDRWNRRSGLCPGVQLEVYEGTIDQRTHGGGVAAAPTLRAYLVPDRISAVATPALVRFGVLGDGAIGVDVAARAGVSAEVGNIELTVDSSPLSYLSRDRWHSFPITVRLAALLD
jgi:hypothetical protein